MSQTIKQIMTTLHIFIGIIIWLLSIYSLYIIITDIDFAELTGCHQSVCSWEPDHE